MPDLTLLQGIRWEWADWIPEDWGALYATPPPRLARSPHWWATHGRCAKREKLAEEIGHHLSGQTYRWDVAPPERDLAEAKAKRRGACWLIEDADVARALSAGYWDARALACLWQVSADFAQRRVDQFLARYPGWRPGG